MSQQDRNKVFLKRAKSGEKGEWYVGADEPASSFTPSLNGHLQRTSPDFLSLGHLVSNCHQSRLQLSEVRERASRSCSYPVPSTCPSSPQECPLSGVSDRMRSPKGGQRQKKYNKEIASHGQAIPTVFPRRNNGFYIIKISPQTLPPTSPIQVCPLKGHIKSVWPWPRVAPLISGRGVREEVLRAPEGRVVSRTLLTTCLIFLLRFLKNELLQWR